MLSASGDGRLEPSARVVQGRPKLGDVNARVVERTLATIGQQAVQHRKRLPRSPWNFGDGGPGVIVTQ